ncbi:hypothetical protein COY26_00405 [Candidatus Woesearchaeota archaeon CG_4_10_14_0_2_um_filter_33_10]|nr:MAG: hypothetical protein COY26_00405 [Candidatus Woesearchaeota archaeon CG_4_10_14_0_2_um_filter_33_10]
MQGMLIAFKVFDHLTSKKAVNFFRGLYGYKDYSNNGKYTYSRKGLLDDIPHVKLIRGLIIMDKKDSNKIIDFMNKSKVEFYVRTVVLTKEDQKMLLE